MALSDSAHIPVVTPEIVALLDMEPACAMVLLSASLLPRWCNDEYRHEVGEPDQTKPFVGASEEILPRLTSEPRTPFAYYEFTRGCRRFVQWLPVDPIPYPMGGWLWVSRPALSQARPSESGRADFPTLTRGELGDLGILSRRELEVMRLVAEGLPTKTVAKALHRAPKTVANQITSLHRKLRLSSRGALTRFAVERGITAFTRDDWMRLTAQAHEHGADAPPADA